MSKNSGTLDANKKWRDVTSEGAARPPMLTVVALSRPRRCDSRDGDVEELAEGCEAVATDNDVCTYTHTNTPLQSKHAPAPILLIMSFRRLQERKCVQPARMISVEWAVDMRRCTETPRGV